jgi:hypothetical protein
MDDSAGILARCWREFDEGDASVALLLDRNSASVSQRVDQLLASGRLYREEIGHAASEEPPHVVANLSLG